MSDDRFTYIHLPHEASLWSYVEDQVDWNVESLEDRFDQEVWDLIPPYQNEDDEGLLPSHAHPSYPYGNPYESQRILMSNPSHARHPINSLASGTSLLAAATMPLEPFQPQWPELAIDNLLWPDPSTRPPPDQNQSEDGPEFPEGHGPQAPEGANRPAAEQTRAQPTPATPTGMTPGRNGVGAQGDGDEDDGSEWDEGPSGESDRDGVDLQ
ncbi:hypothetical protein CROQUDRAFT_719003 [Cronartium quercuum f. sp. fusiforme G11]|uniref:Uncharacterized protein n=1 Tax=Cronartium quercuum f. sp. fusiforme G11 TaxID=708437 RepID=A0A9P6T554_9BASI|nr:hypothetical protein CROQUDRAFT_719003 [Cronartium quercuum f. sp. fusiforme G11]